MRATLINYHHSVKRGPNERKLSTTLKKGLGRFKFDETAWESIRVAESAWEFQAKREREFKLSTTLIPVSYGLKLSFTLSDCHALSVTLVRSHQILTCSWESSRVFSRLARGYDSRRELKKTIMPRRNSRLGPGLSTLWRTGANHINYQDWSQYQR